MPAYDVIIAGTGVSGLYAALNLDPSLRVLMLSKRESTLCNSALAQGGIAAVTDEVNDSVPFHLYDSLVAGGFRNDPLSLGVLVNQGPKDVRRLIELGVEFDQKPDGAPDLTLEGGHSRHRILHHEDATGFEILSKLLAHVRTLPNVTILENAALSEMKQSGDGYCAEVLVDGDFSYYTAPCAILATGGIGRVYEFTTNSAIATGDGIALAWRMGADIRNLHLVQFHPTAFANRQTRECFLISESVRGEGAYLLNCHGERFMHRYDERLELAPRDVVSHAIILEQRATGSDQFFLDITHKEPSFVKRRFPMIYSNLLREGYDLTKDRVPIYPCQHYLMGGINVDDYGRTGLPGLYALGECAHTGVHGNNRLASNSLLEAIVFPARAAEDINQRLKDAPRSDIPVCEFPDHTGEPIPTGIRTEVRRIMQSAYFVMPDKAELLRGYERVCDLKQMLEDGRYSVTMDYMEARALVTIAYIILKEVI